MGTTEPKETGVALAKRLVAEITKDGRFVDGHDGVSEGRDLHMDMHMAFLHLMTAAKRADDSTREHQNSTLTAGDFD
jgi:hypothetical protein